MMRKPTKVPKQIARAARRGPHTHVCTAGEHTVEHGNEPCSEPLRYECPSCLDELRATEEAREARERQVRS